MNRAAIAALVALAALVPSTAGASFLELQEKSGLEVEDGFCTDAPKDVDRRIVTTVDALSVGAVTTPPIAVLDTGVDPGVPEIGGRVVDGFDATTGALDGSDVAGHGTQVAAIAAGSPGLLRGVSPTSPIMPVRIYNRTGDSSATWLVAAINWAASHGAAVINISGATTLADADPKDVTAVNRAIAGAFNRGALVVAAMGNSGKNEADIPAALPHVLAVGASDGLGGRATFSNTGSWVDLLAPGSSLTAPLSQAFCPSGYGVANGTSFAAPAVAGAAALLAQLRPELSAQQRFDILRTSARDVELTGRDDTSGFGMLDVQKAIDAPAPPADASPEIDDDAFFVRGPFAAKHPTLLKKRKTVTVKGSVSRAKDPADVYPVQLKKGWRMVATATTSKTIDSNLEMTLWKPAVGDFDISDGVTKQRIVDSGGFSAEPDVRMRSKRTATYFLSVEAADLIDDDEDTTDATTIPASEPYTLKIVSSKIPVRTTKKKTTKKKAGK